MVQSANKWLCDRYLLVKKTLLVLSAALIAALPVSGLMSGNAQAKSSPMWPFGSGCSLKEAGKTKSNNSKVCVKSGSTYKWVDVLRKNDVYNLSSFCSTTIKTESSGSVCGWNEKLFLSLVAEYRPKDICIDAMRQVVYELSRLTVSGYIKYPEVVSSSVREILKDTGCKK
jgi:hypothetical protein